MAIILPNRGRNPSPYIGRNPSAPSRPPGMTPALATLLDPNGYLDADNSGGDIFEWTLNRTAGVQTRPENGVIALWKMRDFFGLPSVPLMAAGHIRLGFDAPGVVDYDLVVGIAIGADGVLNSYGGMDFSVAASLGGVRGINATRLTFAITGADTRIVDVAMAFDLLNSTPIAPTFRRRNTAVSCRDIAGNGTGGSSYTSSNLAFTAEPYFFVAAMPSTAGGPASVNLRFQIQAEALPAYTSTIMGV